MQQQIRENSANILPQMLANNEIKDLLSLEKTTAQQEEQNKQLTAQIEKIRCLFT